MNTTNERPYIDEQHKSLKYNIWTITQKVVAADIQSMGDMNENDYKEYIENYLIELNHHNIIKSSAAGYPIACNKRQLELLIQYLTSLKNKLNG